MKIKCIANKGLALSQRSIIKPFFRDLFFDLEIEKIYTVYSISYIDESLEYLLSDKKNDSPTWYSAELFQTINLLLPLEWYFTKKNYHFYMSEKQQVGLWGYKEMIFNKNHIIDLEEQKTEAVSIFLNRKQEIDEYEELNKFRFKKIPNLK